MIGRLGERFIESGWLIASIVVATFLNPFSAQVFEPDKAALLHGLAILMLAAWVIRGLEHLVADGARATSPSRVKRAVAETARGLWARPIAALALALALVYVASTLTSISPRMSWWGSYQRGQGTYTFLIYLTLFFVVLSVLRREDQLQRLVTTMLLTSFPVAVYAILQHYGLSLVRFAEGGVETRVISTLGNAIFLAAYLAMVVPLTLWRLLRSARAWSGREIQSALVTLLYGGLFVLQLLAVVFTQSRGPLAGLMAELIVFVLLVAVLRRRRRWALAGVLLATAAVAVLVALNVPGLAPEALQSFSYLRRLRGILGSNEVRARLLAWDTVLQAVRADPLRVALGYGPETMKSVLTGFMPAELWVLQGGGQYGTFDRAHNAVFDALYAQGLVGVITYLSLYGLIFYQSLRWLGLVRSRRAAGSLAGLLIGGAVVGLVVPWLWHGDLVLMGVGVPAGMIVGLILYLIGNIIVAPVLEVEADEGRSLLLAALLAAIVGHLVETQTGIGTVATRSYFWLYTALIILLGTDRVGEPERISQRSASASRERGRGRRGRPRGNMATSVLATESLAPTIALALVTAALLGTLSYAFIHGFSVEGARVPARILIWCTWLFAGLIILLERDPLRAEVSSLGGDVLVYAAVSLVWVLPFVVYHRANAQTLERLTASYGVFVGWLLLTVAGIAVALQWGRSSVRSDTESGWLVAHALILALALAWVWQVDITRIRADIYEKVGQTALGAGYEEQAIPNLQRAVALQLEQDQYYVYLGGGYVEQARLASDVAAKDGWMEQARQVFERGQALAPLDSDHPRQLGLAYRVWADWAEDSTVRRQRLQRSLSYYQAAVRLNPENPDLRLDLASAYFALGMSEEALAQYQHAVEIGSPDHLGRAHAGLGDVQVIQGRLDEAMQSYRQAMAAGRDKQEVVQARISAVDRYPEDIDVRESLALVYAAAGRRDDALTELKAALDVASNDAERAEVEDLIKMVRQ